MNKFKEWFKKEKRLVGMIMANSMIGVGFIGLIGLGLQKYAQNQMDSCFDRSFAVKHSAAQKDSIRQLAEIMLKIDRNYGEMKSQLDVMSGKLDVILTRH